MKEVKRPKNVDHDYRAAGCVWCDAIMIARIENVGRCLKDHIKRDCKKHPMRKLEKELVKLRESSHGKKRKA